MEELNREHPLPEPWAWALWGDGSGEVNVPVAVSGKRWVATRGNMLLSIDDMERRNAPASVCLAVLLATAGLEHPARVEALRADLLSAREEIARLRARVRVEAADVERAGVTRAHVEAWLRANGWQPSSGIMAKTSEGPFTNWQIGAGRDQRWVSVFDSATRIAQVIGSVADVHGRVHLDILDEMAAIEVQT